MLDTISLFAGIGGFDLGLERTGGFRTVAVAETDPYASKILALRFPDAPNVGDVTKAEYPDAQVIVAGFPCQDISFAGAGAGLTGERSGLFWEVVRAIRVVRPEYVILENVAALLSRGLDDVLRALAEVGYDAEWHCIPASAVGAPHRRDRIWIIAHPRGEQHEGGCPPISGEIAAQLLEAVANAQSERRGEAREFRPDEPEERPACGCEVMAHTDRELRNGGGPARNGRNEPTNGSEVLAYACGVNAQGFKPGIVDAQERTRSVERQAGPCDAGGGGVWATEPDVGRVAHGVPSRVDRLRCLGNAVVPQIPELIGRAILEALNLANPENKPTSHSPKLLRPAVSDHSFHSQHNTQEA